MKVDKSRAIKKAYIVWRAIQSQGFLSKNRAYIMLNLDDDYADCPFCEMVVSNYPLIKTDEDKLVMDCNHCPARVEWKKVGKGRDNTPHCYMEGSPYKNWSQADDAAERYFWAGEMVKLIEACAVRNAIKLNKGTKND